jgi:ABC-2 type transport system permease protein
MRTALAIAKKELSIYFTTPWAYVVFTAMVGISSFFFISALQGFAHVQEMARVYTWARLPREWQEYRNLTDGVVVPLWRIVLIITTFVAPLLSMGLFAREKRQRTFELLMTAPVRPWEIVLGKYLGGLGIITATLGTTLFFPIILAMFGASESGQALEWQTVLLGWGGLVLWGACCMVVGMFLSALTESEMLAAVITFIVMLMWMLVRGLAEAVDEPLKSLINYISFDAQLDPLMKGMLEPKALVFLFSVIAFSLLLTNRAVEAQRWA